MTYDQWKATDAAGDDADVRERECTCDEHGCGFESCPIHRETIAPMSPAALTSLFKAVEAEVAANPDAEVVAVKLCRCRACGAQFPNPYGGGVEAALCDACLDTKPTDEQLAKLRR